MPDRAAETRCADEDGRRPIAGRGAVVVFCVALLVNLVAWYGGIRSPDGEVVFETCEALYERGTFAVTGVSRWTGFGLAPGADGRQYSVFGPGQSVACVPTLAAARAAERAGVYPSAAMPAPSASFYVGDGLEDFVRARPPDDARAHAARMIASLLEPIVAALAAAAFWRIASVAARHPAAAAGATALFVAGSPMWPYSGTFFSEPLATSLLLAAIVCFRGSRSGWAVLGGLCLGAAVTAHVTALLAVPFLVAWAAVVAPDRRIAVVGGSLGVAAALLLLMGYDLARFGDPLETGRWADPALARSFGYGVFVAPWRGLYGLLASPGKGLVFYMPATLLALWAWPSFRRRSPALAWLVAAMFVVRVVFVASRSDWHGGFSLGPRLLVQVVPFVLLSIVSWLDERLAARDRRALALFAVVSIACIAQQAAFVIGEPFSFYQKFRIMGLLRHVDVFAGDRIFLDASFSPALHLLQHPMRGSWLLRHVPVGQGVLWFGVSSLLAVGWLGVAWWICSTSPARKDR